MTTHVRLATLTHSEYGHTAKKRATYSRTSTDQQIIEHLTDQPDGGAWAMVKDDDADERRVIYLAEAWTGLPAGDAPSVVIIDSDVITLIQAPDAS